MTIGSCKICCLTFKFKWVKIKDSLQIHVCSKLAIFHTTKLSTFSIITLPDTSTDLFLTYLQRLVSDILW